MARRRRRRGGGLERAAGPRGGEESGARRGMAATAAATSPTPPASLFSPLLVLLLAVVALAGARGAAGVSAPCNVGLSKVRGACARVFGPDVQIEQILDVFLREDTRFMEELLLSANGGLDESCCASLDALVRHSTCLCDEGLLGTFLQQNVERVKLALVALAGSEVSPCWGLMGSDFFVQRLGSIASLSELDETKVCKCRSLLERLEREQQQRGETRSSSSPPRVQSFGSRARGAPAEEVLQFDSFSDAKAFFTEEKISQVGSSDPQTVDLIRSTCL
mmetsp:Transcript_14924/g.37807  ORF Transcript_14924/g.37807 Transcript_14924/m.37807 type:complete len:278 (+) Transcript_14924:94-927(+)